MRVVGALLTCRFEGRTCDLIRGTSPPILVPGLGVQKSWIFKAAWAFLLSC